MNRSVSILINGTTGPVRKCGEYGLPQGSVLSPILFRFYINDMDKDLTEKPNIDVYKFADDGTVKVIGETMEKCLKQMAHVCASLSRWTATWRMVINCQQNKTEIMCFSNPGQETVPKEFKMGSAKILSTEKTKVLGVIIDEKLRFKLHTEKVYNKLIGKWVMMSRYSNRSWGFNQKVTRRIIQSIMFSTLFYASMIWMQESNIVSLKMLVYKIMKSAIGAVFHISEVNAEIILELPPMQITNTVFTVKHYLKILSKQAQLYKDPMMQFVEDTLAEGHNIQLKVHVKMV